MLTDPTKQAKVVVGVALGMRYLHRQKVVHRDLKPANILVEKDMSIRICDFGLSRVGDTEVSLTDNWGTAAYMAPEIAAAEKFSFPVDVFAFACTWYEIITGKLALVGDNRLQLNRSAIEGSRNEIPAIWNPELVTLLTRCWAPEQRERPTFDEILHAFEHQRFALVAGVNQPDVQAHVGRIIKMEGRPVWMTKEAA
jgi:serine/threonine protein kinase